MSRSRFEADYGDEDLDPPSTYEPIKVSRVVYTKRHPNGIHTLGVRRPKPYSLREENLYTTRRLMAAAQRQVFAKTIAEALDDLEPPVDHLDFTRPHASIPETSRARQVFQHHFADRNNRRKAALSFNDAARRYMRRANHQRPLLAAELGELGIFGVRIPDKPGLRFVGIHLTGEGADALKEENKGMMSALNAAELCVTTIGPGFYNVDPHLSLATTSSHRAAEAAIAGLNDNGLVETLRERLATPDNPGQLVSFGRILPELSPIQ